MAKRRNKQSINATLVSMEGGECMENIENQTYKATVTPIGTTILVVMSVEVEDFAVVEVVQYQPSVFSDQPLFRVRVAVDDDAALETVHVGQRFRHFQSHGQFLRRRVVVKRYDVVRLFLDLVKLRLLDPTLVRDDLPPHLRLHRLGQHRRGTMAVDVNNPRAVGEAFHHDRLPMDLVHVPIIDAEFVLQSQPFVHKFIKR